MTEEEFLEQQKKAFAERLLGENSPVSKSASQADQALQIKARSTFEKLKQTKLAWPILELSRFADDNEGTGAKACREALQEIKQLLDRIDTQAIKFLDIKSMEAFYKSADTLYALGGSYPETTGNQISFSQFGDIVSQVLSIQDNMMPVLIKLITITSALRDDGGLTKNIKEADQLLQMLREGLGATAVQKNTIFLRGLRKRAENLQHAGHGDLQ